MTALNRFIDYLRHERRYSAHTVAAYQRDLEAFCRITELADPAKAERADVQRYAANLHASGRSPRTIARSLSSLRAFFRFDRRGVPNARDPMAGLQAPKARRPLPKNLDVDRAAQLFSAGSSAEAPTPIELRDLAMVELLYGSGLRLSELVGANCADVDMREAVIRVTGKGAKERLVPVGSACIAALKIYLASRPAPLAPDAPLFTARGERRISQRTVQSRIKRWGAEKLGSSELHPHMLRHSFASHLLESSGDLRAIQELLGHADIATTQIYTHLDFQHLAKVYDAAHPRAGDAKEPVTDD